MEFENKEKNISYNKFKREHAEKLKNSGFTDEKDLYVIFEIKVPQKIPSKYKIDYQIWFYRNKEKLNDISQDQIVSSYKKEVLSLISNESRSYKEMRIKKFDLETAQKKLKYLKGLKYFAINIDKLYSQMQDMELEDFKSYVQKLLELDRETIDIILEMKMDSIVGIEKVVKKLEGIIADLRKEIEK